MRLITILWASLVLSACVHDGAVVTPPSSLGPLTCFSVEPPSPEPEAKYEDIPSCDKLCAEKGAVCTGMQNGGLNPPVTCSDPAQKAFAVCRCCKTDDSGRRTDDR